MLTPDRLRNLIRREDPLILDVGCNDGEHTQMFLDLFPFTVVYSFEPEPRAIDLFQRRIQDPRARLIQKAVGAIDGHIVFHQSDGRPHPQWTGEGWHYSGSIRQPKNHLKRYPWCRFDRSMLVPITRLDSLTFDRFPIDFIWADVQGAERDLILGGIDTLHGTRFLYTEYSNEEMYQGQPTLKEIQMLLPEFEVVEVFPDDVLLRNKRL